MLPSASTSFLERLQLAALIDDIQTYIHNMHNWLLQTFSQVYDRDSYTNMLFCVNFRLTWRNLQFKVYSQRHFFQTIDWFALRVFFRILLRESRRRNVFFFLIFRFNAWALSLISQNTTYLTTAFSLYSLGLCKKFNTLTGLKCINAQEP